MTTTREQILERLRSVEPDLESIARMGPQIVPDLISIVSTEPTRYALGAVGVAGMIGTNAAVPVVTLAARKEAPELKSAAAAAARGLPLASVDDMLSDLLAINDMSVRKWALRACERVGTRRLVARIKAIASDKDLSLLHNEAVQAIVSIEGR